MMLWLDLLIAAFVFYEAVLISIWKLLREQNPEMNLWVLMGSKVLKLLLAVGAIVLVPRLTEIPVKQFALATIGIYVISIVFETVFFLKKNKK